MNPLLPLKEIILNYYHEGLLLANYWTGLSRPSSGLGQYIYNLSHQKQVKISHLNFKCEKLAAESLAVASLECFRRYIWHIVIGSSESI